MIKTISTQTNKAIDLSIDRDRWIKRNKYYHASLAQFLRFSIPANKSILEIGCGSGYLLNALEPKRGVGIDLSAPLINVSCVAM